MKTYSPAELSGSVVVPEDDSIFSEHAGRVRVNGTDGYRVRWGLMTGAIDPRWPFADCDGSIETQGPSDGVSQSLASTSEDGIDGPDEEVRFAKAADPDDAGKACFVMRRVQGDEETLMRTEISFSPTFTPIPLGAACWLGFAFRVPVEWKAAGATDETMVFQIHETADVGDDTQPAPIGMLVKGQGMLMWIRSNPNATTDAESTVYTQAWSEDSFPSDQWQFFALRLKSHWDAEESPSLEVWRRVGGVTEKIVSSSIPNAYNNTARDYAKTGIYYYDDEWSGDLTERQLHHKGLFQWLDGESVDESAILDFLESI